MTPTSLAYGDATTPSIKLSSVLSVALAELVIANSTDELTVTDNGILRLVVQERLVAALEIFVLQREKAVWQKAEAIVQAVHSDDSAAVPFAAEDRQYSV